MSSSTVRFADTRNQWAGVYALSPLNYVVSADGNNSAGTLPMGQIARVELSPLSGAPGAYNATIQIQITSTIRTETTIAQAYRACDGSVQILIRSQSAELTLSATQRDADTLQVQSGRFEGSGGYPQQQLAGIVNGRFQRVLL